MLLNDVYNEVKDRIKEATDSYKKAGKYEKDDLFAEMCFCLLTPQSKARNAWTCITNLKENKLLYKGNIEEITPFLNLVRFKNNKAKYIVELREKINGDPRTYINNLGTTNIVEIRNILAKDIKGMGMKEASHFLRNIGYGMDIAILDRHILKNLVKFNVIPEIPKSITVQKYVEIEQKMKEFSKEINIDMESLDLVMWYMQANDIFK